MSALVAIGEPAVAELSGLLQDGNYGAAAAETLRSIKPGSASLETLRKLLSSEVPESRAWAANVLGSWRDKGSVEGFKRLARDKDRFVREKAIEAYWLTAAEYDADLLLSLLKDESENVRLKAMTMLSKQPDKRAVDILLDVMNKGETLSERAAAMAAAGFSKDKSVVAPLIVALADKDEIMVSQAIYFLGYQKADIASNDILSVIKNRVEVNDETIIQNAAYALIQFGKPVDDLSIFYRFLGKKWDHDTKREVLKLFGSLGKKGDQKLIEVVKKFKEGESEAGLLEMADEALMKLQ
jgi:HEAT repeat protein